MPAHHDHPDLAQPQAFTDAEGTRWEIATDLLRDDDGRILTREEVSARFGPLVPTLPEEPAPATEERVLPAYEDMPYHPQLFLLEELREAMCVVESPTPAEVRAYVRTVMGARDLVGEVWTLADLTAFAEALRHTGIIYARLDDHKVEPMAAHLEMSTRTLLRKYPLPKVTVRTVPDTDPLELYERRHGSTTAQPLLLQLDLENGDLSVFPFPEVNPDSRPEGVDTGVLIRWDLPLLTPNAANTLMRQVEPLARRMLFGADLRQDKTGLMHASLDEDADQARAAVDQLCADQIDNALEEHDADTFFGGSASRTAADLDLTAASTPEQIAAAAADAERQALGDGVILLGADEYLQGVVSQLEVDTELVLAVMEGPYTGDGDVAEYGILERLLSENTEVTAWVNTQQPLLEENTNRWIAVTFDPIDSRLPVQIFDLDETTACTLTRELDQHTPEP